MHQVKTNCVDKKTSDPIDYTEEHTGFVWAFTREWYKMYEFDDMIITGMGDTIFANSITKRVYTDVGSLFYHKYRIHAKSYNKPVIYESCDLHVYHLNHGPLANRQYANINYIMKEVFLNQNIRCIDAVLVRRKDGILEYHKKHIGLFNSVMLNYFKIRDDDWG